MKEIKTIRDLKDLGLLKGLYPGLVNYYYRRYNCKHVSPYVNPIFVYRYQKYDPYLYFYTCGADLPKASMERYFLSEPVQYLKYIDYSKISNFGHGKKEAQMKAIFDLIGLDWGYQQ